MLKTEQGNVLTVEDFILKDSDYSHEDKVHPFELEHPESAPLYEHKPTQLILSV